MSRMKLVLTLLLLTTALSLVPQAQAAPVLRSVIAGSDSMWQALALAAYNTGSCLPGSVPPCFHYTSSANFTLTDIRPPVADTGRIWIVWDSLGTGPHVWIYIRVDSLVGDRCYFAHPRCRISVSAFPATGNLINTKLWLDNSSDTIPPAIVQALFSGSGTVINTAATDIRPEDALFAQCRANSTLDAGLNGLGYGINPPGTCPAVLAPPANLNGQPIKSAFSSAQSNNAAFNISGKDPYTNQTIPAFTTISVGAAPIVFLTQRNGPLAAVKDASDAQLQTVFGGTNCDGSVFGGSGAFDAILQDPLSGTMNVAESTVFRYPNAIGTSQEQGVNPTLNNPLVALPCSTGSRSRAISNDEEVSAVRNNGRDSMGYIFFNYGHVSSIANNPSYGYLQLNGVDPIFQAYGTTVDFGQPPVAGELPGTVPCVGGFPCPENQIWAGGLSYPNLRLGCYRAWAVLRLISDDGAVPWANTLAAASRTVVINVIPDFVPFNALGTDPGLRLLRSHYPFSLLPVNLGGLERGRDAGGCVINRGPGTSPPTDLIQQAPNNSCILF